MNFGEKCGAWKYSTRRGGGGGDRFPDADLNFHIYMYVNNVCICTDWKVLTQ